MICRHAVRHFHHQTTPPDQRHTWSVLKHIYNHFAANKKHQQQPSSSPSSSSKASPQTDTKKYSCFLLNLPKAQTTDDLFARYKFIWDEAELRVAVDGSANYLARRNLIQTADIISGDFDSIDAKILQKLKLGLKPQVVETPCQKETDFTKALRVVMGCKPDIHFHFGLYYADGSRIDHIFGLINTLHLIRKNIFLINIHSDTVSWLLFPGAHTILKPRGQELCSLIPFNGPAQVKTQGLRYNLVNSPINFGGVISTSNICQENRDSVQIETNREILWSIDLDVSAK